MKFVLILPLLCLLALSGCDKPEVKAARYIRHGNALFDAGAYEKARVEYKSAAQANPTDPEPSYRLGLIDEAEGNLKDAFGDFTRAAQQDSHYQAALLKLAEYYMIAGHYEETQARIDDMLRQTPDDAEARALHAALLFRQKNYGDAVTEAQAALKKDTANVVALSVIASVDSERGDNAKAIADIDAGLTRDPKNLSLLLLKANLADKTGNPALVSEVYQNIFAAAPKESKYRIKLAVLYTNAQKLDQAEKVLRDGIAALPDDWELKHQLAQFLSSQRSMESAEAEIRKFIAADPERPEPYAWLTDLYISHNELDRAEASLNDALAHSHTEKEQLALKSALAHIDYAKGKQDAALQFAADTLGKEPNNLDALFIRARIEADEGSYQNAIADLRAILRDRPNTPLALSVLAEVVLRQGFIDLAIETLNQLAEVDPLNLAPRIRLAQLYSLNKNPQHAMDILFAVTKLDPKLAVAWETVARVAISMHDWDTADMAIGKLDALDNQHNIAGFLRGQLLDATGKTDQAIQAYRSVIDADPSSPASEQAMTALVVASKRTGHLQDAVTYLENLKTDSPIAHALLGTCYLADNQRDKAIAAFDAALAARPRRQDPYLERARLYFADHDNDKALSLLGQAAAAIPADPRASIMEAELLAKIGHAREAVALYTKILARDPDLDAVANNLAELVADSEYNDPAALETARQVAERFAVSNNPLLLDTLAWVYYRQGRTDQAQALMVRASSLQANLPPQFHYHFGAILHAVGNNQQAAVELRQAIPQGADYPGLDEAKSLSAQYQ